VSDDLMRDGVAEYIGESGEKSKASIDWMRVETITKDEEHFDLS